MNMISADILNEIACDQWRKSELDLTSIKLDEKTFHELILALKKNSYIYSLRFSWSNIQKSHIQMISTVANISILNVALNALGPEEAKILATMNQLSQLDIHQNKIGNTGAKALAKTNLRILNVSENEIGNDGLRALARSTTITSLNVLSNQISDWGVKPFSNNTVLKSLDASSNKIGSEGAKVLATLKTLTRLNLSNNIIDFVGALALANNPALNLSIFFNSLNTKESEKIDSILFRRRKARENWFQLTPLLAFVRANQNSLIKTSIFPLLPDIAILAGSENQPKKIKPWVQLFMDTLFFKDNLKGIMTSKTTKTDEIPELGADANRNQKCLPCILC